MGRAEIEKAIRERDEVDRNKPTGRLAAAPDAQAIDTSHLTIDQVCDTVAGAILVSRNNPGDIRGL
jgi:cytidylate kinase